MRSKGEPTEEDGERGGKGEHAGEAAGAGKGASSLNKSMNDESDFRLIRDTEPLFKIKA